MGEKKEGGRREALNHEETSLVIMQVCDRCISFSGHTRRAGLIYDPQNVTVVSLPEALMHQRRSYPCRAPNFAK